MDIAIHIKLAVVQELQQVHGREVTGRVVEEHVLGARVGAADFAVFWASVPGIDGVVELDARISAGPGGVTDLLPQIARLDGLCDLAIHAADQRPIIVIAHGIEEGIGHAHRVVRVLAGHGRVGLRVPIGVVGCKLNARVALARVVEDTLDVGLGDFRLLRRLHRRPQPRIGLGVERISLSAIPRPNRSENLVKLLFVELGARDE